MGEKHWRPSAALCNGTCVFGFKSWLRASGTALQYRWPDTEWKEEPAEPISYEHDVFRA